MKPYLIILTAMWPFYSLASTACDLEKARAEVAASLAGAPRAFASVGEATSSEKNAVVGMSSSLAGHRAANLTREAAQHSCSAIAASELVEQHLAFSEMSIKRDAARQELRIIEVAIQRATQIAKKMSDQLAVRAVTVGAVVEAQHKLLALQQRQSELLSILAKQGAVPVGNVADALSSARFHEAEAQRLLAEAQAARGWDVVVSAGARRPLSGGKTEPFASIVLSWSFGHSEAAKAAADVGQLSQQVAAEKRLGATQSVLRRAQELETEQVIIHRRLSDLEQALTPIDQALKNLTNMQTAEAEIMQDTLILKKLQIHAEQANLEATWFGIEQVLNQLR